MKRRATTVATGIAAVMLTVTIAGCTVTLTPAPGAAAPDPSLSPSISPSPSASPEPSKEPTASASPSPGAAPLATREACAALLDPEARADIDAEPALDYFDDFAQRQVDQGTNLRYFVELGGVACQVGQANTDNSFTYGYSPIGPELATEIQAELEAEGFVREESDLGVTYGLDTDDGGEYDFLFTGTEWYHSSASSYFPTLIAQSHSG